MADSNPVSPIIYRHSDTKCPQIVHQPAIYPSPISSVSSFYHPKPTITDFSELADINMYAHNRLHTDDDDFKASHEHSKAKRRYSDTPHLPAAPRLSPFPSFRDLSSRPPSLSDGSASPVFDRPWTPEFPANLSVVQSEQRKVDQAPEHIGWDEFRSFCASIDVNRNDSPKTLHTPWPKADKQMPPLASKPKVLDAAQEKKNKQIQSPSVKKTTNFRKHSDMETLIKVHKLGKKLQVVYHQGPKGEGQKMWNGIRRINKEKRELKPTQAHLKTSWTARSPRTQAARTQAQKEQLDSMHAAALGLPAPNELLNLPPLQSLPRPPVPTRPAPLGVMRSPVIHKPFPGSFSMEPRMGEGSQGKVSTMSNYTYHSRDVPVIASRSVQYDSKENIIGYFQTTSFVPKLDPAPKPKAFRKKGLPPRPVLRPGKQEPPELAKQMEMFKLRVGTSPPRYGKDELPPAPKSLVGPKFSTTISQLQNKHPAGSTLAVSHQFPYAAYKPSNSSNPFISLDAPQTECPRHVKANKATKDRFADAFSNFFDPTSHHKEKHSKETIANLFSQTKDKARLKHEQKLKEYISGPRPVVAPGGFAVNFAAEAGGIGGPAAAVAVAPRIPNPAFIEEKGKTTKRTGNAGKLAASTKLGFWGAIHVKDDGRNAARGAAPPPVPPIPKDYGVHGADREKARGKKKDRKANWAVSMSNPFSLSRRDSDASMMCADARVVSDSHVQQQLSRSAKGKQKADEGPGGELDMRLYKGPVRQFPDQQVREVRDPGPSRQGEWHWEGVDEKPKPLGARKETGESFYPKYASLIREYGGAVDEGMEQKGGEDKSVWF